jgi:hypothetical protein
MTQVRCLLAPGWRHGLTSRKVGHIQLTEGIDEFKWEPRILGGVHGALVDTTGPVDNNHKI